MGTARSALLLGAVACLLAGCASAGADEDRTLDGPVALVAPTPGGPPLQGPAPLPEEALGLPPVTAEMHAVLDEVQRRWGGHPDLGQPEISRDRALVVLRWHGTPPPGLSALAGSRDGGTFEVRVEETPFRDGELVEEAGRLVRENPGVVTAAGPRAAGDGIVVGLHPSVAEDGPERLGLTSRFPLFPEVMDAPVPIPAG
ncbi:hypothetical protein [Blastococcus sp. TF02A-35]|uniref:hypothetical protein n=1 Tax=Blastococcus sp. TF02A-35 TaxID=2559612 RepID=UPI0010733DD4|nr:hypothetical protein [Blastococcus sp. TF02A_35]TFV52029.1 hypothetical protein E4P43_08295 [Blastococcus sp. TF02A_35]